MATFQTFNLGGIGAPSRKLGPLTSYRPDRFTLDARIGQPPPAIDITTRTGGCPAGHTMIGEERPVSAGEDVVVCGSSAAAGVLTVETRVAGVWGNADSDTVLAGESVYGRVTIDANATHYRLTFTCGSMAANWVEFYSQRRPPTP